MNAPQTSSKQRNTDKTQGGILMGIFIGVLIGLGVALAVAIYINFSELPFIHDPRKPLPLNAENISKNKTLTVQGVHIIDSRSPDTSGNAAHVERVEPTESAEHYHFYNMLTTPQHKDTDPPPPEEGTKKSTETALSPWPAYVIAGEFTSPSQADDLRAQLALSGIEASLQNLSNPHRRTIYRVRIGPFQSDTDTQNMVSSLSSMGLTPHVLYHAIDKNAESIE